MNQVFGNIIRDTCNTEARQSVQPLTFIPISLGELTNAKYIKK